MKWPCSLQYVAVFPKYLYTNWWSAFSTAKCEIGCEMHWNAQRSKPNWDLFLHALRRSVRGRDLSLVPLTFCIFVEWTREIMSNYYKSIGWRTFQLSSKNFSLSTTNLLPSTLNQCTVKLIWVPQKILFIEMDLFPWQYLSGVRTAEPHLRLDVRWKGLYLHWSLTNAGVVWVLATACWLWLHVSSKACFQAACFPKPACVGIGTDSCTACCQKSRPFGWFGKRASSSFRCDRAQAHHWRCSSVVIFQPHGSGVLPWDVSRFH